MAIGQKYAGRKAGTPNKVTAEARQAIALFVDQNAHRLTEWLDAVAEGDESNGIKPNPAKAFELFQSVVEYHVPKLARTEIAGDVENPVVLEHRVKAKELMAEVMKNIELNQ
jgi:hypothetical protein